MKAGKNKSSRSPHRNESEEGYARIALTLFYLSISTTRNLPS